MFKVKLNLKSCGRSDFCGILYFRLEYFQAVSIELGT